MAAVIVLAVVLLGGAALVGSGVVRLPSLPLPPSPPDRADSSVDPGSWTWTATGSMRVARAGNSVTVLPDGTVLVAGGGGPGDTLVDSAELYDSTTGAWTPTGSMRDIRGGHSATLLPDGTVLVAGGDSCDTSALPNCVAMASAELYDPTTGAWTATGSMLQARSGHVAILLTDGTVLALGGWARSHGNDVDALYAAELYDPATRSWTATGSMLEARDVGYTATLLPDGTVLVTGGTIRPAGALRTAERYSPRTGVWSATGDMSYAARDHTATLLPDGTVLVAGGQGLSTAQLYDPGTGTWSATRRMGTDRYSHTATLLLDGTVLVVGGAYGQADHMILDSAERYDPRTGSWVSASSLLNIRKWHTATLLPDGSVLVIGGTSGLDSTRSGIRPWIMTNSAEVFGPVKGD